MKTRIYLALIALLGLSLFAAPVYGQNDNNRRRHPQDNNKREQMQRDNNSNQQKYVYKYKGHYRNFDNDRHANRFYFRGKYYSFPEYYGLYNRESNAYTFEGSYGDFGNVYIFTDRYGNELDLYVKPVKMLPRYFKGYPLRMGYTYDIKIVPEQVYVSPDQVKTDLRLSFGWGVIHLSKGGYFDLFTSPHLINYRGQLYVNR
jgi:hypothetical protein